MTTLLVDGDILVYSIGFSCETRWYEVECEEDGIVYAFESRRDIPGAFPGITPDEIHLCRTHMPLSVAEDMMSETILSWLDFTNCQKYKVYLTGGSLSDNYRYKMYPAYKGNRKDNVKPIHYKDLRDFLISEWGAEVVVGIEADDALGMAQRPNTIIASKDKDLLQVPGKHYVVHKNKIITATENGSLTLTEDKAGKKRLSGHGFKWFCAQMLLGDAIDNIPGISRMGDVRTHKLLAPLRKKEAMWEAVEKVYQDKGREDIMTIANLLWILRKPGEYFSPEVHVYGKKEKK